MRNVLVGSLFAVSFFMLAYKGRRTSIWWLRENLFANIGAIFALCTAVFPSVNKCQVDCSIPISYSAALKPFFGVVHNVSATLFFLILAYFPLVLFKEKDQIVYCGDNLINVKKRNLIFRICGHVIIACIFLTMIFFLIAESNHMDCSQKQKYDLVFWVELVGLWAFGFLKYSILHNINYSTNVYCSKLADACILHSCRYHNTVRCLISSAIM